MGKYTTAMIKFVPNILTLMRLMMTSVFLMMILYNKRIAEENRWLFLDTAFVIFVVAGLTDFADGMIARKYNVTSKFGRIADPLADKILVCGAFICFAIIGEPKLFNLDNYILGLIHWFVAGILIARDVYVTALRHLAEARGINFAAILSGKIKVFLHYFTIGTVMVRMAHVQEAAWGYWFTTATLIIMLTATIISGLTYQIRWRKFNS